MKKHYKVRVLIGAAAVALLAGSCSDDDWGDAELLSEGGDDPHWSRLTDNDSLVPDDISTVDEISLGNVSELQPEDDGSIMLIGDVSRHALIYHLSPDAASASDHPLLTDSVMPFAIIESGRAVYATHVPGPVDATSGPEMVYNEDGSTTFWDVDLDEVVPEDEHYRSSPLRTPIWDNQHEDVAEILDPLAELDGYITRSIADPEGGLLVATVPTALYHIDLDGTVERLVGSADDGTAAASWEDVGDQPSSVVDITSLTDGRLALAVRDDAEQLELLILDGDQLRRVAFEDNSPLQIHPNQPNELLDYMGEHMRRRGTELLRLDMQVLDPLNPAPDGRLITIGASSSGTPVISLVDVDTGDVEEVVRLSGLDPTLIDEDPENRDFRPSRVASAAPLDDRHLVFLADGKLWIIRDVFDVAD